MKHCAGCADTPGFGCSKYGGEGACPEDVNRPRSVEGRGFIDAAHALMSQLRAGPAGVTGIDANSCLALLTERGVDPKLAVLFLPWWEAGMLQFFAEKRDRTANE